jgi:cbb3-type cytochrome oxidase cytochrome c subunit
VRGHRIQGPRDRTLLRFDFWLIFRRPCASLAVYMFCGALLVASGAGFGQEKPADTASKQADTNQLWIPQRNAAEHCTTCHPGAAQPGPAQSSVPKPYSPDPLTPHHTKDWGCTVCHRGEGAAAEKEEAHQPKPSSKQPLLPIRYIQASCGLCHHGDLPDAPQLNRGRQLLNEYSCVGCHRLADNERSVMLGPDLTDIGTKVSPEWIYKWLKEPRTVVDSSGNMVVNGYEMQPRMPQFQLDEKELRSLTAFLSSLHTPAVQPYKFNPQVLASLENSPDVVDQGEARFRQMFCTTCHSVAVTRAGETKLIGGDIGPELTKAGSKVNPDWLVAWLLNPQAYLPKSLMPRYEWSEQDLYVVTRYIKTKLTDADLLSGIPKLGALSPEEIRFGRRVFLKKGCGSCHAIAGIKLQEDFGPDLSHLGAETVSHLQFGNSGIPRNLTAYIETKIKDPSSLNPTAQMPQFRFDSADLDALTTAILSMTGSPSSSGMERLIVPRTKAEFHPTGAFEQVYERYKCYVCHQFNGYGGTLAPDLSYEGSRAQRQWMVDFLKNPQTLRPALILRMPQFNMTDQEASILADYMGTSLQSRSVNPASVDPEQFTSQMVAQGKQLYEGKYQCQACHTIGTAGGYVGPDLSNIGNWMTPAWIEAWLRDPQALVPGSIEPRRTMTTDEVHELTAYLMSLRQNVPASHAAAGAGEAP